MKRRFPVPSSGGSTRRGFTLVELLVVIGIIALLISILLPALNKARAQAQAAKCAANMRSALQAVHIYINENKGWLPGPHTSGARWNVAGGGGDAIGPNETSSDETPLQNMDWISPSFGKTFKWPENDFDRLRQIYNVQLACPSNTVPFNGAMFANDEGLVDRRGDINSSSYSAVIEFHAFPSRELNADPKIYARVFKPATFLQLPNGYAPQITKVGAPAKKAFLIEGSRFIVITNQGTWDASFSEVSFNAARYQIVGGNFMISGPYSNADDTPYQLYAGNNLAYTSKRLTPIARTLAWRHNGKMNLAFFDGHVELRAPADSIQVGLYLPRGTRLKDASGTYDPTDKNDSTID